MTDDSTAKAITEKLVSAPSRRPASWAIFVVTGVVLCLVLLSLSFLNFYQVQSERHDRYVQDQAARNRVVVEVNAQVCDIINYLRSINPKPQPPDAAEVQLRQHISCPIPTPKETP